MSGLLMSGCTEHHGHLGEIAFAWLPHRTAVMTIRCRIGLPDGGTWSPGRSATCRLSPIVAVVEAVKESCLVDAEALLGRGVAGLPERRWPWRLPAGGPAWSPVRSWLRRLTSDGCALGCRWRLEGGHARADGDGSPAGAVPGRADRVLLSDAGVGIRGGGRRAGDPGAGLAEPRSVRRGQGAATVVAAHHRDQRLPRYAAQCAASRTRRGPRSIVVCRRVSGRPAAGEHLGPAGPRQPCPGGGWRSGGAGRATRDDPACVRRRATAPAAPAASGADLARGAVLDGG